MPILNKSDIMLSPHAGERETKHALRPDFASAPEPLGRLPHHALAPSLPPRAANADEKPAWHPSRQPLSYPGPFVSEVQHVAARLDAFV